MKNFLSELGYALATFLMLILGAFFVVGFSAVLITYMIILFMPS